jgi:hypothetical protein
MKIGVLLLGCLMYLSNILHGQEIKLSVEQAQQLCGLPLRCITTEYPNKLGQVLNNEKELASPDELHPVFYGCFDWHSSVHGHWLLVSLLKRYGQNLSNADSIRLLLEHQFTTDKIDRELAFFKTTYNGSFERTYGWAWLLQLQLELESWNDAQGLLWAERLSPLSAMICEKYKEYLPKLLYPIRSGEHTNSAFGMAMAFDFGQFKGDTALVEMIRKKSIGFYGEDRNYAIHLEPSGHDFLSPALQEADLMRRVLDNTSYYQWMKRFLPQLGKRSFTWEPGKVSDRSDGKLVHLDGLNFNRAWCLNGIAKANPKKYNHLREVAKAHMEHSFPFVVDGDYMGEHWLASFAMLAIYSQTE